MVTYGDLKSLQIAITVKGIWECLDRGKTYDY